MYTLRYESTHAHICTSRAFICVSDLRTRVACAVVLWSGTGAHIAFVPYAVSSLGMGNLLGATVMVIFDSFSRYGSDRWPKNSLVLLSASSSVASASRTVKKFAHRRERMAFSDCDMASDISSGRSSPTGVAFLKPGCEKKTSWASTLPGLASMSACTHRQTDRQTERNKEVEHFRGSVRFACARMYRRRGCRTHLEVADMFIEVECLERLKYGIFHDFFVRIT